MLAATETAASPLIVHILAKRSNAQYSPIIILTSNFRCDTMSAVEGEVNCGNWGDIPMMGDGAIEGGL